MKIIHKFLSYPANKQTSKQTNKQTSMLVRVLLIVGQKCTLATSHAASL